MILFNLLISIAYGDCLVDGVQFDIGGRAGSGVTAVDHSNPITLTEIKGWDIRGDDVSTCDVSFLTDLKKAFFSQTAFNQDIGSWDVSNVTNMVSMFQNARTFNQNIRSWDTSNVTDFTDMFSRATAMISTFTGVTGFSATPTSAFFASSPNPTTDRDVFGSINAQNLQTQSNLIKSISAISSRLGYLRQNRSGNNFAKNNIQLGSGNVILTSLVKTISNSNTISPKLNLAKLIPDNWSPWSEGSISLSKIGKHFSETESQSLAFGFDRKLNNNNLLGFAIQYSQSDTDVGVNGTGIDSKNYNLSLYQTRPLNDNNFIEGLIGVGIIGKDLTRKSGDNTLTGSRDGVQIFGSINYGKTINKGDFNLTPIARVDLGYTELDAYTETGTDALSYGKQTVESGTFSLGLELKDIIKFSNSLFKPFGLVEYGLDFSDSSAVQKNESHTSTTHTYVQSINSTHLLTSEVGFNYEALENLNIKISYKHTQGSQNEYIDTVKFGFKFKSQRETEYAMNIDGSEDLKAGFNISKNINGFDLKFNANQAFYENSDQAVEISLSGQF